MIVNQAEAWKADLVVVGTRGHGLLQRMILGSTARTVLQHAPMSVLIVPPTAPVHSAADGVDAPSVGVPA